jgi:hypothetical protein
VVISVRSARCVVLAVLLWAAWSGVQAAATIDPSTTDLGSAQIIAALNQQRLANGIPAVRNDPAMAAGCAAYNRYVLRNGLSVADQHFEVPGKPGYTAAGDHAARTSVLAVSIGASYPGSLGRKLPPLFSFAWAHGNPWDSAPFHLFQMMNPALAVSGADERTGRLRDRQWVRLECLNTFGGPFRSPPATLHIYLYPHARAGVPAVQVNEEGETVLGTPAGASGGPLIFAYFFGRRATALRVSTHATLNGKPVSLLAAYSGGASGANAIPDAADPPGRQGSAQSNPSSPSNGFNAPEPSAAYRMPLQGGPLESLTRKSFEVIKYLNKVYGDGAHDELTIRGIAYPNLQADTPNIASASSPAWPRNRGFSTAVRWL